LDIPHALYFLTFGILREPRGHPTVQGFYDRNTVVGAASEQADGFVDRSHLVSAVEHTWGPIVTPRFFVEGQHARAPMTLSLWDDVESVFAFAYSGVHAEALSHRSEWFIPREWPTYVAWWVEDDHRPDFSEATERLEYLHDCGPSARAFDFKHLYGADGEPTELDRSGLRPINQAQTGAPSAE